MKKQIPHLFVKTYTPLYVKKKHPFFLTHFTHVTHFMNQLAASWAQGTATCLHCGAAHLHCGAVLMCHTAVQTRHAAAHLHCPVVQMCRSVAQMQCKCAMVRHLPAPPEASSLPWPIGPIWAHWDPLVPFEPLRQIWDPGVHRTHWAQHPKKCIPK